MLVEKHDLLHEFPEYSDAIQDLNLSSEYFARLFSEYHDIDNEVNRIETGFENTSDDYLEGKKIRRLRLKDELYQILKET